MLARYKLREYALEIYEKIKEAFPEATCYWGPMINTEKNKGTLPQYHQIDYRMM